MILSHSQNSAVARHMLRRALLALAGLALACSAHAQRLLVRTETLTTLGEAVRVYAHSVDLRRKEALPGGETLPGVFPIGPMLLSADARAMVLSSGSNRNAGDADSRTEQTFLTGLQVAPFTSLPAGSMSSVPGWRQFAACVASNPDGAIALVVLGSRTDHFGVARGRLDILECGVAAKFAWPRSRAAYGLPGPPVGAALIDHEHAVAVLCQGPYGEGAVLHVHDLVTGKPRLEAIPLRTEGAIEVGAEPTGIAVSRDGRFLILVISGRSANRPDGEPASWLYVYDAASFTPQGNALELAGVLDKTEPSILPVDGGGCWLSARTPGTGFAHVFKIDVGPEGPRLTASVPITGVARAVRIAPGPDGASVAVGIDNRLEVWPSGHAPGVARAFTGQIGAVTWTAEGLFVGEAGRVHQIDPTTANPVATVQLQSGHVQGIVVAPAAALPQPDADADGFTDADEQRLGTSPTSPDTDGDGIPDGSDAEPVKPSPRLTLPAWITLNGDAAGQELRSILIAPHYGEHSTWQVYWERQAMPWLVVSPTSGATGTPFYLGINPSRYGAPAEVQEGKLRVYLTGADKQKPASGSPATIGVWVRPRGATLRRILWIEESPDWIGRLRDADAPGKLNQLATLVAAPPLGYSHHEVSSAYVESFHAFPIVVLTAAAAARGAITRQAVLDDYVARGGALLFLGGRVDGLAPDVLARWLAPVGIHIDTTSGVDGVFDTKPSSSVTRDLKQMEIHDGCALRVNDPALALAPTTPNADATAFAVVTYGAGRIAVLASPTPLQNAALQAEPNVRFAHELFQWLSQAGKGLEDIDGDGIPDRLEDRNGNGRVDSGETDRLNPDTDGDGICDGDEDLNRNGRQDDGETSPINPDSNSNGIRDGADEQPLPPAGSPVLLRLEPPDGPAEGGYSLLISGRNLPSGCAIRFGDRPAIAVKRLNAGALVAIAPPCPELVRSVDVALVGADSTIQTVLPDGFRYTPRSAVSIALKNVGEENSRSGRLGIWVTAAPGVAIGRVSVRIATAPPASIEWGAPYAGPAAESAGRVAISRPSPDGVFVDISAGDTAAGGGLMALLPWKRGAASESIAVSIKKVQAMAPNGESLNPAITSGEIIIGDAAP